MKRTVQKVKNLKKKPTSKKWKLPRKKKIEQAGSVYGKKRKPQRKGRVGSQKGSAFGGKKG